MQADNWIRLFNFWSGATEVCFVINKCLCNIIKRPFSALKVEKKLFWKINYHLVVRRALLTPPHTHTHQFTRGTPINGDNQGGPLQVSWQWHWTLWLWQTLPKHLLTSKSNYSRDQVLRIALIIISSLRSKTKSNSNSNRIKCSCHTAQMGIIMIWMTTENDGGGELYF